MDSMLSFYSTLELTSRYALPIFLQILFGIAGIIIVLRSQSPERNILVLAILLGISLLITFSMLNYSIFLMEQDITHFGNGDAVPSSLILEGNQYLKSYLLYQWIILLGELGWLIVLLRKRVEIFSGKMSN